MDQLTSHKAPLPVTAQPAHPATAQTPCDGPLAIQPVTDTVLIGSKPVKMAAAGRSGGGGRRRRGEWNVSLPPLGTPAETGEGEPPSRSESITVTGLDRNRSFILCLSGKLPASLNGGIVERDKTAPGRRLRRRDGASRPGGGGGGGGGAALWPVIITDCVCGRS